jgi:hypothetical protein
VTKLLLEAGADLSLRSRPERGTQTQTPRPEGGKAAAAAAAAAAGKTARELALDSTSTNGPAVLKLLNQ